MDTCRVVLDLGLRFNSCSWPACRAIPVDAPQLCVRVSASWVACGGLSVDPEPQQTSIRPPTDLEGFSNDSGPRLVGSRGEGSAPERPDSLPKTKIFSADDMLDGRRPGRGDLPPTTVRRADDSSVVSVSRRRFSAASRSTRSSCSIIRCTRKYLAHWSGSLRNLIARKHHSPLYIGVYVWLC